MLLWCMIGGGVLGALHRLGLRGKISSYGMTETPSLLRIIGLGFLVLTFAPYAGSPLGFALMLCSFLGAWKLAQVIIDAVLDWRL